MQALRALLTTTALAFLTACAVDSETSEESHAVEALESLVAHDATLVAGVAKVKGATGGPARVMALV